MASRTRSLSNFKRRSKAQFFILSAFIMITILFVVSQFIQPSGIFDTASAVLMDEVFVFNNIKEKSVSVVKLSESCGDLALNLEEYKEFAQNFVTRRNARLVYDYNIDQPCNDAVLSTRFYVVLISPRASADSTFTATRQSA